MMDMSFDAFGNGTGWGDQGEQEYNAVSNTQRLNAYEKTPIPVSIADLLKMANNEEKFHIGSYSFNTIKVMGIVASMQMDEGQTCITYELNDPMQEGVKMAPSFTVIRYHGMESYPKSETLREGTYVQAVGKLRAFNNRLSLISFHIGEVPSVDEVELFQLEAKIASLYYGQNIPERTADQIESLGISLFACTAPVKGANSMSQSVGQPASQMAIANGTGRRLYQHEPSNNRGLVGQQAKIYEYIKVNCSSSSGVSVDEIRRAIKTDGKFSADLNYLLGDGVIYNTIDDNHFAVIE